MPKARSRIMTASLPLLAGGLVFATVAGLGACSRTGMGEAATATPDTHVPGCPGDNGGLRLAPGFCATVFADGIGHARHLAVAADGTVYANTWSGAYFKDTPDPSTRFLVAMKDGNGDGKADSIAHFGATAAAGATGGTGIALYKGALFAEEDSRILRYALAPSGMPDGAPQVVLSGLPLTGDHNMHPIAISPTGALFVDLGSATNACEVKNRMPLSPGNQPCTEKQTRAGIWLYDANKTGQVFSAAGRYASGIRNGEGIAWDEAGRLYATQHGRDQLGQNWKQYYTLKQGEELPAEELVQLVKGGDYGWPECYYDSAQKSLMLAPEYGGDGKTVGLCAGRLPPVAAFPAHWAPNGLTIYHGAKFPAGYRGGAFIAFHGSWNRAPAPQGGYNIVFQPLAGGKASGPWIVFADGFAGPDKSPGKALHRPAGITEGPDGALYVADDVKGRIWRITYNGTGSDAVASAAGTGDAAGSPAALPPEGMHPDAGKPLPAPPGASAEQVAIGRRIFAGEVSDGTCSGCHGEDGIGTAMAPALNTGTWAWGDGSLAALTATIEKGVPQPKSHPGAMPPLGGASLSKADVAAVSAYVWAIGHAKS